MFMQKFLQKSILKLYMVFHFSARSETVIKAFDKMSFGFLQVLDSIKF